ncbi:toxin-antitoxin system YwqK family antitoxin [Algoriphagus namhaensis]|uniref:Toxin-antitoxin system YwqK family antitoxin n=1 Tax=Algoriphagus namhaensis TaxID=915353 RepID=A0ABV8AXE1_9BACT
MRPLFFSLVFSLLISFSAMAQKEKGEDKKTSDPDSVGTVNSALLPTTMPLLLFDEEKEKEEKKEKKKKARKNIWFGVKTRKGVIQSEFRGQDIVELFNFTDAEITPDPYIRDIYWFDPGEKEIKTSGYSKEEGYLLHGPYERQLNEVVVESGMFYYGTKHKTWMLYDAKNVLQDKDHFSEGWPRESRITYYEQSSQTIEQIIPVQFGLEEGNYFYFYENRQVAVTGEYQYGEKVGLWTEYWNTGNTKAIRKREIQYQEEAYTKNFRPYIRAEWDKDGNLIYRKDS